MNNALSFGQQVLLLEKKRAVLQGLIHLSEALEQLRSGLQAMLQLGGGGQAQLSLRDMRAFETIRARVAALSDTELRASINTLDQRVQQSLGQMCQLALQLVDDARTSALDLEQIQPRVNEFNRFARTAIAMRILLERRGQSIAPLQLPLPQQEIEQRLHSVSEKERGMTQALVKHIQDMRSDLALMLENPACSSSQQQFYQVLDQALAANLSHIEAGLSLAELPMPIDSIEVGEQPLRAEPQAPTEAPAEPEPEPEAEPAAAPQTDAAAMPQSTEPLGFVPRLKAWLHSPWHVGWKDVGRGAEKKTPDKK